MQSKGGIEIEIGAFKFRYKIKFFSCILLKKIGLAERIISGAQTTDKISFGYEPICLQKAYALNLKRPLSLCAMKIF